MKPRILSVIAFFLSLYASSAFAIDGAECTVKVVAVGTEATISANSKELKEKEMKGTYQEMVDAVPPRARVDIRCKTEADKKAYYKKLEEKKVKDNDDLEAAKKQYEEMKAAGKDITLLFKYIQALQLKTSNYDSQLSALAGDMVTVKAGLSDHEARIQSLENRPVYKPRDGIDGSNFSLGISPVLGEISGSTPHGGVEAVLGFNAPDTKVGIALRGGMLFSPKEEECPISLVIKGGPTIEMSQKIILISGIEFDGQNINNSLVFKSDLIAAFFGAELVQSRNLRIGASVSVGGVFTLNAPPKGALGGEFFATFIIPSLKREKKEVATK